MAWIYLFLAGLLEIGWAIGLKYTEGFTRILPTVLTVSSMILSLVLLGVALKALPVGHGLCGLDRHRRHWHRPPRDLAVWRTGDCASPILHRAHPGGYCRPEVRHLKRFRRFHWISPIRWCGGG